MNDSEEKISDLLKAAQDGLEEQGRILGETLTEGLYGLKFPKAAGKMHYGTAPDGRMVQVRATFGRSVDLNSEPDYLIALKLRPHKRPEEIYNGPGVAPWANASKRRETGQKYISFLKLSRLMENVEPRDRIPQLSNWFHKPRRRGT